MNNLEGKTILVAGGAGYLGVPLCQLLAAQGANVCIGDVNQDQLDQAIQLIGTDAPKSEVWGQTLDVANEASVIESVAACAERFGELHGLVNATSGASGKPIDDLTGDDFDAANRINLTGPFLMAREAAKHMKGAGSIVM